MLKCIPFSLEMKRLSSPTCGGCSFTQAHTLYSHHVSFDESQEKEFKRIKLGDLYLELES